MSRFRSRWLAGGLFAAGCSLLSSGCAETSAERTDAILPTVRLVKLPPNDPANKNGDGATFGLVPVLPSKPTPTPNDRIVPVAHQSAEPEKIAQLPAQLPDFGLPAQAKQVAAQYKVPFVTYDIPTYNSPGTLTNITTSSSRTPRSPWRANGCTRARRNNPSRPRRGCRRSSPAPVITGTRAASRMRTARSSTPASALCSPAWT